MSGPWQVLTKVRQLFASVDSDMQGQVNEFIEISAHRQAASVPVQWQDEGERSASISVVLASLCDVGKELLAIRQSDGDQASQVHELGADAIATEPGSISNDPTLRVVVPSVPGSVPTQGLATLDAWAMQAAVAQADGQPTSAWLPSFLFHNVQSLVSATCAADFLGCRPFLDLMLEVQLLRVALMETEQLNMAMSQDPTAATSWSVLALTFLKQAAFCQLPCLRSTTTHTPEPAGTSPLTDAAGPSASSSMAAASAASPQGRDGGGEAERVRGGSGCGGLPLRLVTPQQMETLVARLEADRDLMRFLSAWQSDIRKCLYRLGFKPALVAREGLQAGARNGKALYLRLPLTAPDLTSFAAMAIHYKVVAVTAGVEAHDQGWSSYPEDHNTYRNSWTWGELELVGEDGTPVHPGEPGRLYTNLHAVSDWQQHIKLLGPGSQLVRDLNAKVFGTAPAASAAVTATATAEDQSVACVERCYSLALRVCACFPGWEHFVRRADLVVHLKPVGMGPEECGGSGGEERMQVLWTARHKELLMYDNTTVGK